MSVLVWYGPTFSQKIFGNIKCMDFRKTLLVTKFKTVYFGTGQKSQFHLFDSKPKQLSFPTSHMNGTPICTYENVKPFLKTGVKSCISEILDTNRVVDKLDQYLYTEVTQGYLIRKTKYHQFSTSRPLSVRTQVWGPDGERSIPVRTKEVDILPLLHIMDRVTTTLLFTLLRNIHFTNRLTDRGIIST